MKTIHSNATDPRWKDLYKINGITVVILELLIVLEVIAFVIWPYSPRSASTVDIYTSLQRDHRSLRRPQDCE